jgi:DNA-binding NarL/FixJ family response regulator
VTSSTHDLTSSVGQPTDDQAPGCDVRVVVVDDHVMVADALCALLEREPDICVVGTAASAKQALHVIERARPDVVLLDNHLPDADGVAVASEMSRRWPATKVVMLSGDCSEAVIGQARRAGCSEVLSKEHMGRAVAAAVRAASAG